MEGTAELLLHLKAYEYGLCRDDLGQFTRAAWNIIEPGTEMQWNDQGAKHHDAICVHVKAVVNHVTNQWPGQPKIPLLLRSFSSSATGRTYRQKAVWTLVL
jgi:hypothetical protein